jgi:hypothetical protein
MSSYPNAGHNAPPGVQESIEEYFQLPEEVQDNLPLLYFLLGSGTPEYKMSKRDSDYVDRSKYAERCKNCDFAFQHVWTKKYICSQIRGEIFPAGWCRLWISA